MMTCQQLTELVTDYAEGRLGLLDRARFQLHLGLCHDCREYLRQVRATARALGRLEAPKLPETLQEELMRRFDGWKPKE